jgi:hypothetical protein
MRAKVTDYSGWLARIVRRWQEGARVPDRVPDVVEPHEPTPSIPAAWLSLYTYLQHRYASTVVLTFGQMEALLGRALPDEARVDRNWWTETGPRVNRCSDAWTATRRTATPNLLAQTVAFERRQ